MKDRTSNEPPQEETAGSEPPQAEKVARRGTNPSSSQSQSVDPPSLAQPPAIQDDHHPPLSKLVRPTSGRSLTPPALEVTNTYSSRTSEMALGERRVLREIPVYSEEPDFPNEAVSSTTKGSDDLLIEQPAPVNVSSPVRHSTRNLHPCQLSL